MNTPDKNTPPDQNYLQSKKDTAHLSFFWCYWVWICLCLFSNAYPYEIPTLMRSARVDYDQNTVRATGNVFVFQDQQIISADQMLYNQQEDTAIAQGHVWIRDSQGNYLFAPHITFENHFQNATIENIRVLMQDEAKAAANQAIRIGGNTTILSQGVYSPCVLCKENPEQPPIWQIKADKIIHDQEKKILIYHHAWMEVFGIPVIYTPYFYHPDPTVKRQSGFLAPRYGSSRGLGFFTTIPYFQTLGVDKDILFSPTFTTRAGVALTLNYRQRLVHGHYRVNTSRTFSSNLRHATHHNPQQLRVPTKDRWHLFLKGRYDISQESLVTIDFKRASDLTYLRRYPITHSARDSEVHTTLVSQVALEHFSDTQHARLQGYAFQSEQNKTVPLVTPSAHYIWESKPGNWQETWAGELNLLHMKRQKTHLPQTAKQTSRLVFQGSNQLPYITQNGQEWRLSTTIRTDIYHTQGYQADDKKPIHARHTPARFFPQLALLWRYPLISYQEHTQTIIEPTAMLITGTQGQNRIDIPNEDAQTTFLEESNLFGMNRHNGYDRLDTGHRFVVGLHSRHYFSSQRRLFVFIGQSFRLDHRQVLSAYSGEHPGASDYVVSATFAPTSYIGFTNRSLLSRHKLRPLVSENTASFTLPVGTIYIGHSFLESYYLGAPRKRSQVNWRLVSRAYYNLHLEYDESRNLTKHRHTKAFLSRSIILTHTNSCVITRLSYSSTGFRDRDLRPEKRILLQIDFKNLGSFYPLNIGLTSMNQQRTERMSSPLNATL